MKLPHIILTLFLILCSISITSATTYYVSPTGTGNGLTIGSAGDPSEICYEVQAGDTVYFLDGTYVNKAFFIPTGVEGTVSHPIRLLAYSGTPTFIQTDYDPEWFCFLLGYADYVYMDGLKASGFGVGLAQVGSNCIIKNCDIGNTSNSAIWIAWDSELNPVWTNVTFDGCKIHDAGMHIPGTTVGDDSEENMFDIGGNQNIDSGGTQVPVTNITIKNCEIYGNSNHQVINTLNCAPGWPNSDPADIHFSKIGMKNLTIENNIFHDIHNNGYQGQPSAIYTIYGNGQNYTIKNNTFYNMQNYGICAKFDNSAITFNKFWNTGSSSMWIYESDGPHQSTNTEIAYNKIYLNDTDVDRLRLEGSTSMNIHDNTFPSYYLIDNNALDITDSYPVSGVSNGFIVQNSNAQGQTRVRFTDGATFNENGVNSRTLLNGISSLIIGASETVTISNLVRQGTSPVAPVANFSANTTAGDTPLSVQFQDLTTQSPTGWSWNFGDSQTSTSQNPTHTYNQAGTYTVTLTASNTAGEDTETKTGYITVTNATTVNFTASPTSGSSPLSVHFTDTSLNTTEQFKIIEDTFCDEDTPAIIHGSENFLNCTYYKRMALVRANVTEDITNAKLHLYAVSTDSTSSIAVYNCSDAWSEATTSYNSAVWPLTTLDTISVSSANTWYAWDVSSNVSTARNYSLEIFDMADGKSSSFYSKEAVSGTYAGYIEGDLSGIEYSWDFGDGNTSTEKNPTHVYSTPGNYTVTHTVTKDSGQSSITKTSLVRVSNATISAIVAPYGPHSNLSQTPRYGGSSTGEYFICTGMATAFEQNCTLSRMKFYAGNTDHITDFRLNIWSTNETNKWYKFKSATPNIASLLTDGYNDLDISQYNINVNEGDHYGLYIKGDTANALAMVCAGPESNWWQDATRMLQSPSLVNEVDWGNVTGEVRTLSINFEATPPNFVVIGDSIMSGTPYSAAPVNQIEDAYYITREPWKVIPNKVSVATNKTFQNAAIAGDKYPNLHDRLALDVISKHPTQAVVEGGINNIIQGDSTATITAGIQAQIEDLQAAGIEPIVLTVLPVNNQTYSFSAAQYQQINDVNAWIISYHETNEDFRIVDARETLGTQDGNGYWIADSQYYDDGIHLSESGMTAVAQLVTNAINHTDGNLFKQAAQNIGTYFSKYFNTFYRFFFQISRRAY